MKLRRWAYATAIVTLAASVITACGGSDSSKKNTAGLEKTSLKVGVLPIPDVATVYLAKSKGYFKAEGLDVEPTILANGSVTIQKVMSGGVDFAYSAYIPIVQAATQGIKVRVVVDGYQGRSNLYPIITLPDSSIHNPKQLAGKKIGLINTKGFPSLLTNAALKSNGVDPKSVHLVEIQYPQMPAALQNHSIDAAFMTEPWLSQSQQKYGARTVVDTMSGPTADLPAGGYVTSQRFAKQYPKTLAAFQRAMAKAQVAAADRNLVSQTLPTYVKGLSPQTAQTITLGVYPQSLSKTRLQRVADLMTEFGAIKQHFDVQQLLQ
jgi:NitT/TauT family transport system substrate-binding protein